MILDICPLTRIRLNRLRRAAVLVAKDETLRCQCAAVALMVKAACGGELLQGEVGEWEHYWNLLPCGNEIDLTSSQFGGNGWRPLTEGKSVATPDPIPIEFLLFAQRTLAALEAA